MADTIRDVIIRIAIQQQPAKIQAPDFSAVTQAYEEASKKVQSFGIASGLPAAGGFTPPPGMSLGAAGVAGEFQQSQFGQSGAAGVASRSSRGKSEAADIVGMLKQQIAEAESLTPALDAAVNEHLRILEENGTDENKVLAQQAIDFRDHVKNAIEEKKNELSGMESAESKRVAVMTAASEKFKQISVSEKTAAFNRAKEKREAAQAEAEADRQAENQKQAIAVAAKKRFDEIAVSEKAAAFRRRQAAEESESAAQRAAKSQAVINRMVGDLRSSGEGAFNAARGIALLSSQNNESLQVMIKRVAMVQGAWDIVAGGALVFRGLTSSIHAATAAGGIHAVAMMAVSSANATVAATALVASQALNAMTAAAVAAATVYAPITIVVVAVTAAIFALAYAWHVVSKSQKDAEEAAKPILDTLREVGNRVRNLNQDAASYDLGKQLIGIRNLTTAEEKLAAIRAGRVGEKLGANGNGFDVVAVANQQIAAAAPGRNTDGYKENIRILEGMLNVNEKVIDREKEKLSLIRDQKKELDDSLSKQKSILETATAAYEKEKQRLSATQESLGKLNAIQIAELKRYGEIVKGGGQLNEGQLKRLEELGGSIGKEFSGEQFRKKGVGRESLLEPFNNGRKIVGEGSDFQAKLDEYKKAADDNLKIVNESLKKAAELRIQEQEQVASVAALLKRLYAEKSAVENLRLMLENMEREQAKRDKKGR